MEVNSENGPTRAASSAGMRRYVKWMVLWSLWLSGLLPPTTVSLRLHSGTVRGRVAPDGTHAMYFGIPYASVTRRFQAPAAAVPWDGVLDAVDEHVRCAQRLGPLLVGVEDCLRLNVYVPLLPATAPSPLPVMVFIHGGGFFEGSGSRLLYGPDYLVDRGIILVTFNYRLSVLGFLCLGTEEVPGNAGLKDQVAALRWVRANIAAFGGDPDNVTIFGESAGGASVSFHIVSPMSAGLFHRAILQSGSSLAPWVLRRSAAARAAAADLALTLGCEATGDNVHEIYDIFMNASLADLLTAPVPKKNGRVFLESVPYVPCLENRIDGIEAFLTESPRNVLSKANHNRVPTIVGFNDEEGYFFSALEDVRTMIGADFSRKLESLEGLNFPTESEKREVASELHRMYLGDEPLAAAGSGEGLLRLSRFYGEAYFAYPALAEALLLSETAPVWTYRFTHVGWRNLAKALCGPRYWFARGASHADDLFYLFRVFPLPAWPESVLLSTMTTLWTNFAKYGEPSPVAVSSAVPWPALRLDDLLTLRIDSMMRTEPLWRSTSLRYWHRLYARYRAP